MYTCFQDRGYSNDFFIKKFNVLLEVFFLFCCFPFFMFLELVRWFWFDSNGNFFEIFEFRFIGVPEAFLIYQQVALSIFSGVVGLISLKVIASIICVGSWALIALIITSKLLLDYRLFLLEAIGANSSRPLPF